MADAYRAKAPASSSTRSGVKGKASRSTSSKNQQPSHTSVLPRIDRRGEAPQKSSLLSPPNSTRDGGLSILLPPRRPSKGAADNSPTSHGDELEGPSTKSAWCTPRGPAAEIPTGSHVASFFGAAEGQDGSSVLMPAPLRLQSVADSLSANEERYRVDMEELVANSDKFFEISTSANQHLDHLNNQLPTVSEAFEQTASALQSLSADLATLHEQHETATREMENQFEAAMGSNTDERAALSEAHTAEKLELVEAHERERQAAASAFREQVSELEERFAQMERMYLDELQELRASAEAQRRALQEANRAERETQEQAAKAEIEALQTRATEELGALRSSSQSAYNELQERSQAELAELQRTSAEELAAVKKSLAAEIAALRQKAAANLESLGDRSARELQDLRAQSDEALQTLKGFYLTERERLLEKASEEISRLRMLEIDQSARMESRRVRETTALRNELDATKADYSARIQALHGRYTAELEGLRAASEGDKALILQAHADEVGRSQTAAAQELSRTIASYEERLQAMTEAHAAEVARSKEDAAQARTALAAKYEAALAALQSERVREKDALILHYETELEAVKRASREEHDKSTSAHEAQVAQLRDAHSFKVLALEMALREHTKQSSDAIRERESELDRRQGRIDVLEAQELVLKAFHQRYAERSTELVEQKSMALSELESDVWRLDGLNVQQAAALESANRALKGAEEDLQVKASTILELTFVIKSRDDEIDKLRNALLDTVQTVNTKTEILEVTTETLSSKAKELEATRNALRLESGRLSMVEQSMSQKVGLLESSELKMESMRLGMENMRLEMKRLQMDMKLQLEHTEGEIELKNGEIRRLHGAQSELKQKSDFCLHTIERLEDSLASAQRQGEEAQRRNELLRLEATQAAEELKRVCDELLGKEQEAVVLAKEKQTLAAEKQRLQIQCNNLTHVTRTLREKVELHTMRAEEIQGQCQKLLEGSAAEKDARMRAVRHLHSLELSAAKDAIRHLEGVEGRLTAASVALETAAGEKKRLEEEVQALHATLRRYEDTDRLLRDARGAIAQNEKLVEDKELQLEGLVHQLRRAEDEAFHRLEASRMQTEDAVSAAHRLERKCDDLAVANRSLESSLSRLGLEKEQLLLSLGQEKKEIVVRAESLQEKVAGLQKEGRRTASELSDLQHALIEKKKELAYLQENLGEQTADTRRVKGALDELAKTHAELQTQVAALSDRHERDAHEHSEATQTLQQTLEGKAKECERLQQSLDIQRQQLDLLMAQHDSHVMQLTDGHRSEAVQLIESHREQIAQLSEDHLSHVSKMADEHLAHVTRLREERHSDVARLSQQLADLTAAHQRELARVSDDHNSELDRLRETHCGEIDRLTDDLHYQVSELTVDRLSLFTEQAEGHRLQVSHLNEQHRRAVDRLIEEHQSEIARLGDAHGRDVSCLAEERQREKEQSAQEHGREMTRLAEERRCEIDRLDGEHRDEVARVAEQHRSELASLHASHRDEVDRLADAHALQVSELTLERLSYMTEQTEEVARLEGDRNSEVGQLTQAHRAHVQRLTEAHLHQVSTQSDEHAKQISRLAEEHEAERKRLEQERSSLAAQLKEDYHHEVARLTVDHLAQTVELSEGHRVELLQLAEDREAEVSRLRGGHQSEVEQLLGAHRSYVSQMKSQHYDGVGLLQEEYEGRLKDIDAHFADKSSQERTASRHVELEFQQLRDQQRAKTQALMQQQMLLAQAADEQIRGACAHSLELLTMAVAHQHKVELMEQSAASYSQQVAALESQHAQAVATLKGREAEYTQTLEASTAEHTQALEGLEAKYVRASAETKQQHEVETNAARERHEAAVAEHAKLVQELNESFAQDAELMRLRLTEEHLTKVNELLERSRVEEERHAAALAAARQELSDKAASLQSVQDVMRVLKAELSSLQTQLQDSEQEVAAREAVVAAKNATIDNVRKELSLLMESSKTTRSSEQFVALLRQQLETHLMEVYHVELSALPGFVLEEESHLLGCLKELFAMRCYRGVAPQGLDGQSESGKAVTGVDDVRARLQELDRVEAALERVQDSSASPSRSISALRSELGRLKLHVSRMFVASDEAADLPTDAWVGLLQGLSGLFERLAVPRDLESAFIRSRQVVEMLDAHDQLMLDAKASCLRDELQSMGDVGGLFCAVDRVLARARELTRSDRFARLEDLAVLFDEWEALHKELDDPSSSDRRVEAPAVLEAGNYLRSADILALKEEAAAFVRRCKEALSLPVDEEEDSASPDDVVDAIEQLMRILQRFELLQPTLGSPRRPSAEEPTPTLENKVAAVLAFVDELQLMAEFAQNILSEEATHEGEAASSSNSLEALRALTRTPSPASTLGELHIDVDLALNAAAHDLDQAMCEFSNDEGDRQRHEFFASPDDTAPSRSPSPFLADSLMDISLVMSDHHRLLAQTARWVATSRQDGARSQPFSVGKEISRLVREHCALLSLSRRLFKMKDPRQELASLLEGVALLERTTARLALFQASSARDADDVSCQSFPTLYGSGSSASESATSLGRGNTDSVESLPRPVLASLGDMARHLQDYDFFLQQIKVGEGRESTAPAAVDIEALVQELNERLLLVEQSKELLGLESPVDELPQFLVGAQEVLRQAKQLRESSVCVEPQDAEEAGGSATGVEAVLSEMDAVVGALQAFNEVLAWMKQVLPQPETVKAVADLKDRVAGVVAQVEALTSEKACLEQANAGLTTALEHVEQARDQLVQEAASEGALLQELRALYSTPPGEAASTRTELLQTLIERQQRVCDDAQQRKADAKTETEFLRLHDLLAKPADGEEAGTDVSFSVGERVEIYSRLLERTDCLRAERSAVEATLQAEKSTTESSLTAEIQQATQKLERVERERAHAQQELAKALAEERAFLQSKELFSSVLSIDHTPGDTFSRIDVYQQLHDKIALLLDEQRVAEGCAAQEYAFLLSHDLLTPAANDAEVPAAPALSATRLGVFQRIVEARDRSRGLEEDLVQESRFLHDNSLAFDPEEPHQSRLAVYRTLLAGQSALIEEKMEREVAAQSEKAFLASHAVPAFASPMEIYEQFVQTRKQLADLATQLDEELQFLTENQLCSSDELAGGAASLAIPFSASPRLLVYRRLLQTEAQAREANQLLKDDMAQQLARRVAADESAIASLTAKTERLEASLMTWQECAYASQREWDRMLLEEEDKRRSLSCQHEEAQKHLAAAHAITLEEVTKARDCAVALASATHAEALEQATKEHERRMAAELHKQAQQLELAAFVHAESAAHRQASDGCGPHCATSVSAAQTRAQLLEKLAKRDTTAISMIYKAIRLSTDTLSAAPAASPLLSPSSARATAEVSTDVTQTVLACVKELKTLKDFLVQSLEQLARDADHAPPPFAKAPYATWMADAVARATADKECAIDLALCSHREFMGFAEVELLTRQEEAEKALARVLERLKAAATNGAFTAAQEQLLALELEVAREKEARENVACKLRLNEEFYRRLLDERKEMEIAQTASVEELRQESKALRSKLDKLEQQLQQQTVLPQFRPPSSSTYASSPRASVLSPQTPRVLKSAAVSNVPMPMRPERPRGGGSALKERFVSDLERETGQRRTSATTRRFTDWKAREEAIAESPGSQLEQDFRAMQAAMTSQHAPALEPAVPTAMAAPATAPGSSLQNQELWYQGVRSIQYVSFFVSVFHVPRQQLFRVEVFNSDTEQQQQTVYVTWTEVEAFLRESRKAVRLGIALPADPEMAVTVPQSVRGEIVDVLFERVRVYGEGTEHILLGFE